MKNNLEVPKVNWKMFKEIIGNLNLEQLNILQVCEAIFEQTYVRLSMLFFQEKSERERLENTVIRQRATLEDIRKHVVYAATGEADHEKCLEAIGKILDGHDERARAQLSAQIIKTS